MSGYETTVRGRGGWRQDPAHDVVDELVHDLSEHLETEQTGRAYEHPSAETVGHLVEDDPEGRSGHFTDTLAVDSHDLEALSAEEAAMHLVADEDEDLDDDSDLPEDLRAALHAGE
jgi:hypothetical protein